MLLPSFTRYKHTLKGLFWQVQVILLHTLQFPGSIKVRLRTDPD